MANKKPKSADAKKIHVCPIHNVQSHAVMHEPGHKIRFDHGDCSLPKNQTELRLPTTEER